MGVWGRFAYSSLVSAWVIFPRAFLSKGHSEFGDPSAGDVSGRGSGLRPAVSQRLPGAASAHVTCHSWRQRAVKSKRFTSSAEGKRLVSEETSF